MIACLEKFKVEKRCKVFSAHNLPSKAIYHHGDLKILHANSKTYFASMDVLNSQLQICIDMRTTNL